MRDISVKSLTLVTVNHRSRVVHSDVGAAGVVTTKSRISARELFSRAAVTMSMLRFCIVLSFVRGNLQSILEQRYTYYERTGGYISASCLIKTSGLVESDRDLLNCLRACRDSRSCTFAQVRPSTGRCALGRCLVRSRKIFPTRTRSRAAPMEYKSEKRVIGSL